MVVDYEIDVRRALEAHPEYEAYLAPEGSAPEAIG